MTTPSRRTVLKTIGAAGTATLVGGAGVVAAQSNESNGTTTGNETMGNETTTGGTPGEMAYVRVVHASPDAPEVDVYVDGELALEAVAFGAVSDYLAVGPGDHQVQVAPTGQSADAAVLDETVTVEAGTYYTVAAANTLENVEVLVFTDDNQTESGMAKLRAVHLSPDAPAVTVAVVDGPVLFEGLAFKQASDYATVDPGTYDLEIRDAESGDVVKEIRGVTLDADTNYSAFALGFVAPDQEPAFDVVLAVDGMRAMETTTTGNETVMGNETMANETVMGNETMANETMGNSSG